MTGTCALYEYKDCHSYHQRGDTTNAGSNAGITIGKRNPIMNLLTIFLIFLLHHPIYTTSNKYNHHHPNHQYHQHHPTTPEKAWPLNKWAREAIHNAETKFQNVNPVVVDPDSNKGTENQKAIYIALEFLKHAASPAFVNHDVLSKDEDRLVKIGRSVVDLVDLAAENADGDADVDKNEEMLRLALQNIVQQCDILASGDLKVSTVRHTLDCDCQVDSKNMH